MDFLVSASTDIGIARKTNQDSVAVITADTAIGKIAMAVMCDGMGGLAKGELASATVARAFVNWFRTDLPLLIKKGISDHAIRSEWTELINCMNSKIMQYGKSNNINLGTTATVLLVTPERYYCLNVGDSRAYVLNSFIKQITEDQTVVARELKYGKITEEQAKTDPRKSVLLQCVGSSQNVNCDMFFENTQKNTVFLLCSDGFRHEITDEEIFTYLNPSVLRSKQNMDENSKYLIELNKNRMEKDNISLALVKIL